MTKLLLLLCAALSLGMTAINDDLNWPFGKWRTAVHNNQYSEETWKLAADGKLEGIGLLVENGDTLF